MLLLHHNSLLLRAPGGGIYIKSVQSVVFTAYLRCLASNIGSLVTSRGDIEGATGVEKGVCKWASGQP